jgi:geranylgeranylglycerol-phosphate geranylgeranyltransferase
MRRSRAASALALVRPRNLLIAAAGVWVGGLLALGRIAIPAALAWAMASALGLGAAGNAANDVFDVEADRINRPLRPLVTGELTRRAAIWIAGIGGGFGLFAAWWVSGPLFLLALAALAAMTGYSPFLKSRGVRGNFAVAVVASLPLVYGAVAVGDWRAGLVPSVLAALLHLAREIVKDVEDVAGDLAMGRRTLPIEWGTEAGCYAAAGVLVCFVPLALLPWAAGWYGWRYGSVVVALDLGLLLLIARLVRGRLALARGALKGAMLVGLLALLWDRL